MILLLCAPFAAVCARWNGEVPGGNAGSLKFPAAADSCKISVVGAGGKFPEREKLGISQQSTRPVGRNFLGPDFRETPGFIRQKENSYLKARWEIPMNDGGQLTCPLRTCPRDLHQGHHEQARCIRITFSRLPVTTVTSGYF